MVVVRVDLDLERQKREIEMIVAKEMMKQEVEATIKKY